MEYQSGAVRPIGNVQDGWEIIKDDYWTFFAMTLTATVILIVLALIVGTINNVVTFGVASIFGAATSNSGDAAKTSAAIVPQLISMVISFFTNIIIGAISGAFFCGIYKSLSKKSNGEFAQFGDLFSGFQNIQSCLIVAAVVSVVQFVISLVGLGIGAAAGVSMLGLGVFTQGGRPNPAAFGGLFLVILAVGIVYVIVNLIVSALTTFAYPLIADRALSGGEALSASVKAGFSNLGGLILLLIVSTLMLIGGAIVCLVGILFVLPIFVAAIFSAYQSVFGRPNNFYRNTPPSPPIFGNQPGY